MGQLESIVEKEYGVSATQEQTDSRNSGEQNPRSPSAQSTLTFEKTDVMFGLLVLQTLLLAYIAVNLE